MCVPREVVWSQFIFKKGVSRSIDEGLEDLFKPLEMQRREPVYSGLAGLKRCGVCCGRHWRQSAVGNKTNISAKHFEFLRARNSKLLNQLRVNKKIIVIHFEFFLLGAVAVINLPRVPKI